MPPRRRRKRYHRAGPVPFDLTRAPQLAFLAILENTFDMTRLALLAQHPELLEDDEIHARTVDPAVDLAALLLDCARDMHVLIAQYRAEVEIALAGPGGCTNDDFI